MPPVANVHGDPPELSLEHGVAQVSLHVVCGLEDKGSCMDAPELSSFPFLRLDRKMRCHPYSKRDAPGMTLL